MCEFCDGKEKRIENGFTYGLECGTNKENTFWIFGDDYSNEIVKKEPETVNLKEGCVEK